MKRPSVCPCVRPCVRAHLIIGYLIIGYLIIGILIIGYLIVGYLMGAGSIGSYGVIGTIWAKTNAADGKRALSAFDSVF